MRLLLISNSTNAGEAYLDYPKYEIKAFLNESSCSEVLFFPYAAVTFSYDKYLEMVANRFKEINVRVTSIHTVSSAIDAVNNAKAIVVGGGNTFRLLKTMQDNKLIETIKKRVEVDNIPYIGWSAGSNMACPTIRTTNDMPIVEPDSFNALSFIPFQINPHYQDKNPKGHAGETREQRILEFIEMNQNIYVAGLREGTMLKVVDNSIELIGNKPLRIFKYGEEIVENNKGEDIRYLLNK